MNDNVKFKSREENIDFDLIMAFFEIIKRLAKDYIYTVYLPKHTKIKQKADVTIDVAKEKIRDFFRRG